MKLFVSKSHCHKSKVSGSQFIHKKSPLRLGGALVLNAFIRVCNIKQIFSIIVGGGWVKTCGRCFIIPWWHIKPGARRRRNHSVLKIRHYYNMLTLPTLKSLCLSFTYKRVDMSEKKIHPIIRYYLLEAFKGECRNPIHLIVLSFNNLTHYNWDCNRPQSGFLWLLGQERNRYPTTLTALQWQLLDENVKNLTQEEALPFSQLNFNWMELEMWLNGTGMSFSHHLSTFSYLSVDWMTQTHPVLFTSL